MSKPWGRLRSYGTCKKKIWLLSRVCIWGSKVPSLRTEDALSSFLIALQDSFVAKNADLASKEAEIAQEQLDQPRHGILRNIRTNMQSIHSEMT